LPTRRSASFPVRKLTAYFLSGWAFFIPYLAVYLLYYWQHWPANAPYNVPVTNGLIEGHHRFSSFLPSIAPIPLLHVYWVLHAAHALLSAIVIHAWWRDTRVVTPDEELNNRLPARVLEHGPIGLLPLPASRRHRPYSAPFYSTRHSAAIAIAPWLLLALVFYIPGVYLEWPSDPWEHLRRITEWATRDIVASHSAGYKSLYFLAYSFVAAFPAESQRFWLDIYYTGMCLLLAWQYYLLARAVGLSHRWAFMSVLINVLTFGNVCFSFYRYYGLASTMLAQLGAVALTRLAILTTRGPKGNVPEVSISQPAITAGPRERPLGKMREALMFLPLCSAILALIVFNHVQGLGIAGLSIVSIAVWRLIEWRRSMVFFLTAGVAVLGAATILWWPRHPLITSDYRPNGWLNSWYGFNLFMWPSLAADRAMQILGLFGIINVAAGLALLSRNHVIGWLTVGPLIALGLPFVAIPFCGALANHGEPISDFHRLLFAIPSGLSLTYLAATAAELWNTRPKRMAASAQPSPSMPLLRFLAAVLVVAVLILIPSNRPSFNRVWNILAIQPDDLNMTSIMKLSAEQRYKAYNHIERILCPLGAGFVLSVNGAQNIYDAGRSIDPAPAPSARAEVTFRSITAVMNDGIPSLLLVPDAKALYTPQSMAAFLSKHWLPNEVALEYAGGPQYGARALASGYREISLSDTKLYIYQPSRKAH
jgi:hypothetical protein